MRTINLVPVCVLGKVYCALFLPVCFQLYMSGLNIYRKITMTAKLIESILTSLIVLAQLELGLELGKYSRRKLG